MNAEALFSAASTVVLPGWLLLILLPRWRWTSRLVAGVILPVLLSLLYLYLILTDFIGAEGGFGSLAEVARLFEQPSVLLAGWVHYLAFDLFIGAWEVRDAQRLGIHHLLVVPCLALTFVLGPIGLLLYLTLRAIMRGRWTVDELEADAQAAG
jgi:hypothetical protein